jgi:hypothetical protein
MLAYMSLPQKILLTFINPVTDISGIIIPEGNYYYKIHSYINENVIGKLKTKDMSINCVLKYKQIIEGMGNAQSWLLRRTSLSDDKNHPNAPSPKESNRKLLCCTRSVQVEPLNIENVCSICLEEIKFTKKRLHCGHKFHKSCIKTWLKKSNLS